METPLRVVGREFRPRRRVRMGKYRSLKEMARCHAASGAEGATLITLSPDLDHRTKESMFDYIDRARPFILPNVDWLVRSGFHAERQPEGTPRPCRPKHPRSEPLGRPLLGGRTIWMAWGAHAGEDNPRIRG